MTSGALAPPLIVGGIIGHVWMRHLKYPRTGEGVLYGAFWMATAVVISHRTLEVQDHVNSESRFLVHAIGIAGFSLALLSGLAWFVILNEKLGFSIPPKLGESLSGAALLSANKTYWAFFIGV